jgi:phage shock protein A
MKQKVDEGEARAEAYGELAEGPSNLDDELEKALPAGGASGDSNTQRIDDLKKQLGM